MKKCPECGSHKMQRDTRKSNFEYKKKRFVYDQPGNWCDDCGEVFLEPSDKAITDLLLYDFSAKVDGRLTTADIKRIRKKMGLTQQKAGDLIGGGATAFSRYETGKAYPTKGTENFLRILDLHPELLEELEKIAA
jgi:HTH-type transcriptional regulator/antitoxin MqsA